MTKKQLSLSYSSTLFLTRISKKIKNRKRKLLMKMDMNGLQMKMTIKMIRKVEETRREKESSRKTNSKKFLRRNGTP